MSDMQRTGNSAVELYETPLDPPGAAASVEPGAPAKPQPVESGATRTDADA